ncbi:ParB/RepB/Spo0J family partition protein [Flavobacteriales bacterium]|jgi:ParB family chromosome partitioning protein|nr:ParB/RepB/Spo0J family partition protein [Flavobacteriales bacterium]
MAKQKKALGRGLSAILSNPSTDITQGKSNPETSIPLGAIGELLIDTIEVNPFQPRTHFKQEALEELSLSIKELGVIQPITVRKLGYDKYQLISGERRFRASQLAGLTKIPAYIRVANDQEMLEMALIENIQRENLDAIEIALSYQLLMDECQLTQEKLAERVGKKRSTVANYLRLLKLNPIIQAGIRDQMIGIGHARALINIDDDGEQLNLYKRIIVEALSVRQTEQLSQNLKISKPKINKPTKSRSLPFTVQQISKEFERKTNCSTEIKLQKNGKGKLIISFDDQEQLEYIAQCFKEK